MTLYYSANATIPMRPGIDGEELMALGAKLVEDLGHWDDCDARVEGDNLVIWFYGETGYSGAEEADEIVAKFAVQHAALGFEYFSKMDDDEMVDYLGPDARSRLVAEFNVNSTKIANLMARQERIREEHLLS